MHQQRRRVIGVFAVISVVAACSGDEGGGGSAHQSSTGGAPTGSTGGSSAGGGASTGGTGQAGANDHRSKAVSVTASGFAALSQDPIKPLLAAIEALSASEREALSSALNSVHLSLTSLQNDKD
jgi:hypothetical protein